MTDFPFGDIKLRCKREQRVRRRALPSTAGPKFDGACRDLDSISAVTLATHDMARAVRFYRMLGFVIVHGDEEAAFTSFRAGRSYLNLVAQPAERAWSWWGRVIFYHSDVDALHASVIAAGYRPDTAPRGAARLLEGGVEDEPGQRLAHELHQQGLAPLQRLPPLPPQVLAVQLDQLEGDILSNESAAPSWSPKTP